MESGRGNLGGAALIIIRHGPNESRQVSNGPAVTGFAICPTDRPVQFALCDAARPVGLKAAFPLSIANEPLA